MRQFIFIALIVSLFGCKDDSADDLQPNISGNIGFSTAVLSKGASTTTETIGDFGVFGYRTLYATWDESSETAEPQVFDNEKVSKSNGSWTYEGEGAWGGALSENFSFFGYSPYATTSNGIVVQNGGKGIPFLTFTISDNVSNQIDLLVSTPVYNIKASNKLVPMNFKHALSRIGFQAFSKTTGTVVKSIEITNVRFKGQLNLNNEWVSESAVKTFKLEYNPNLVVSTSEQTPTDLSTSDNHFLLLPRIYVGDENTKIIFTYAVGGVEFKKEYIVKEDWEKGMTVTYTIDLTEKVEKPLIVTEVVIIPWVSGGEADGNIDGKVKMVKLIYHDGNATSAPIECVQNGYLVVEEKLHDNSQIWNTKNDGTGVSYAYKSIIQMKSDIALYNVDNTVTIGGLRWQKTNLTGIPEPGTDIYLTANPQDFGLFFQWGSMMVYQRESSIRDGLLLHRASLTPKLPTPGDLGYDYAKITNGDPCRKLGGTFKTPTKQQYATLLASGVSEPRTYRGVEGHFFGADANLCDDETLRKGCLFLPSAMLRRHDNGMLDDSEGSGYWTSSVMSTALDSDLAHMLSLPTVVVGSRSRNAAMAVRCVDIIVPKK